MKHMCILTTADFIVDTYTVYFFPGSVNSTQQCIYFTPVNDEIVETNETMSFEVAAANNLDMFVEEGSTFSLVVYDDDGMFYSI